MNLELGLLIALALAWSWSVWQLGRRAGERQVRAAGYSRGWNEGYAHGLAEGRDTEREQMARSRSESQRRGWETRRASVAMRRERDAGIDEGVGNG